MQGINSLRRTCREWNSVYNELTDTPQQWTPTVCNRQFWKSQLSFHILQYLSHTILDDPDSVDTHRPFQQVRCCNYQFDLTLAITSISSPCLAFPASMYIAKENSQNATRLCSTVWFRIPYLPEIYQRPLSYGHLVIREMMFGVSYRGVPL